jgi:hypothetical protein
MELDAIDVSAHAAKFETALPGWKVLVSQQTWDRCIGDGPEGVERINALLDALWYAAWETFSLEDGWHRRVRFSARALRKETKERGPLHRLWPRRSVGLNAVPSLSPYGEPHLLVMTALELKEVGEVHRN